MPYAINWIDNVAVTTSDLAAMSAFYFRVVEADAVPS